MKEGGELSKVVAAPTIDNGDDDKPMYQSARSFHWTDVRGQVLCEIRDFSPGLLWCDTKECLYLQIPSLSTNPEPLLLSSMPHETASYAKRKGINVLAELDVPRHAESWGAGYLALWPSNNCTQPLDINRDFTSFFIDGVLSGAFVSLIQAISLIYSENVLSLGN
ncbi:hypothetical protein Tco_1376388 [Tanacetum coccineum]